MLEAPSIALGDYLSLSYTNSHPRRTGLKSRDDTINPQIEIISIPVATTYDRSETAVPSPYRK